MQQIDIEKIVDEMQTLKTSIDTFEEEYEKRRQILINVFDGSVDKTIQTKNNIATISEKLNINYDAEKLEVKLDPELKKQVISKKIIINDWDDFATFLRISGVKAKDLKNYLVVERSVDKAKIKSLFDNEKLSLEDIKGCYTAKIIKAITIKPLGGANNC